MMLPQGIKIAAVAALSAQMAACANVPYSPSSLVKPSARCMVDPGRLQALKEGDDLVQAYASVARSYGRETSKLRCIQKWARAVTEK